MIRPNPILKVYVAEKAAANPIVAAHRHPRSPHQGIISRQISNHFFNSLLEAHRKLIVVCERAFDAATFAKLLPITRAEYLMFLNKESTENGIINPVLLDRVTLREVKANRLDPDDNFRKFAGAGRAVLDDSAEITVHRCKRGDFFLYGTAGAAILAWLLIQNHVSPLWLILAGLLVGFYLNGRERKRIKAAIMSRRG